MILYGSSFSPFVRKVMVYAAERGMALPTENIGLESDNEAFRRASPLGKIPAFSDGDFSIADSSAILTYLENKYPDGAMTPASPEDRARMVWFEEFCDTVMAPIVFKCFFNRVVAPLFQRRPGDEAMAVEGETQDLPKVLTYLESVVPDAGGFLVGGRLSIADIAVTSPFVNYDHAPCAVDKSKYPRTYAWLESMHARPSYAGIIAGECRTLAKLRG
jgi:glutathione S-transferase